MLSNYYFTNSYAIAAICALSGFLFGFDTGIIAGALFFINKTFHINLFQQQLLVSSCILGAFAGSLCSGKFSDYYGRKLVLSQTALAFIVGTLITTFATSANHITFGRFILGLAIGVSSYTAPLYVSELSPSNIRGRLITLNILAITAGEVIAHYINFVFIPLESWRLMFLTGIIPAIIFLVTIVLLPESPRFYHLNGNKDKAKKIADSIGVTIDNRNVLIKTDEKNISYYRQLLSEKYRGVFLLGSFLGIVQQAIGFNTIMYYGPTLFAEAGFHSIRLQILATLVLALVNFIFTALNVFIVDYVGRRVLLLIGMSVASLSMIVSVGIVKNFFGMYSPELLLLFLVLFVIGYAISIGSIFWLIISEIFPLKIKSMAMSIITAIQWLSNFVVAATFLTIIDTVGLDNAFLIYGSLGCVSLIIIYRYIPETKQVSLETIESNIEGMVPIRYIGMIAE